MPFSATWGGDDGGAGGAPGRGGGQLKIESFWVGQRTAAAASASQTSLQRRGSQSQRMASQSRSQSQSQQQLLPRIGSQTQLLLPRAVSRSESVREERVGSGVDGGALHAALLAAQSGESVSRKGLDRMLSARKRRPLKEDSGGPPSEVEVDCAFGGKKMVSLHKMASVRRKPLMDESRVSCFVVVFPSFLISNPLLSFREAAAVGGAAPASVASAIMVACLLDPSLVFFLSVYAVYFRP